MRPGIITPNIKCCFVLGMFLHFMNTNLITSLTGLERIKERKLVFILFYIYFVV